MQTPDFKTMPLIDYFSKKVQPHHFKKIPLIAYFSKKKVQQDTSSFLKRKHGLMKEISGNHMAADLFLARLSLQTS